MQEKEKKKKTLKKKTLTDITGRKGGWFAETKLHTHKSYKTFLFVFSSLCMAGAAPLGIKLTPRDSRKHPPAFCLSQQLQAAPQGSKETPAQETPCDVHDLAFHDHFLSSHFPTF